MRMHVPSVALGAVMCALAIGTVSLIGVRPSPAQAQADAMAAAQKAQVMIATYQFNNSGYHELDLKLNAGEFVPGALGSVRRGRIAVQSTMWPHDLQADASALADKMVQLEAALRDEDVPTAAPLVKEMHEMYHGLSDKAYAWLSGAAPAEHGH